MNFSYPAYSELAVVATADNTTVTIAPSATADLRYSGVQTQVLQQGCVYQVSSSNYTDNVTGTWVVSDKPVAVFAGDYIAYVPDVDTQAGNPLVQEQLPVCQWGAQRSPCLLAGVPAETPAASWESAAIRW